METSFSKLLWKFVKGVDRENASTLSVKKIRVLNFFKGKDVFENYEVFNYGLFLNRYNMIWEKWMNLSNQKLKRNLRKIIIILMFTLLCEGLNFLCVYCFLEKGVPWRLRLISAKKEGNIKRSGLIRSCPTIKCIIAFNWNFILLWDF